MPDRPALLQKILDISREMRAHALDSDWETVHQKESYRQTLIERCFPWDSSITNPDRVAEAIHEIIELDRSVASLAGLARVELENRLGKLKLGRRATTAYTSVEVGR